MCINARLSIEDNNLISEVCGHDEVVFDNEGRLLGVHDESLDDTTGDNTLFGVEICAC